MSDLTKLLSRVESATGPDRELDWELARVLGVVFYPSDGSGPFFRWKGSDDWKRVPHWTASIDSALALCEMVLPGRAHANGDVGENNIPWAVLAQPDDSCQEFYAEAVTEPLAILGALIWAKIAEQSNG